MKWQKRSNIRDNKNLIAKGEFSSDGSSIAIELDFFEYSAFPAFWVTFKSFCIVFLNNLDTTPLSDIEANSLIADCNWKKQS